MATLRKRNNTYFIDYRINGKRRRKSVGKSKKMAELALKDFEVKLARKELGFESKDSDYKKLFDDFWGYCITHVTPSTLKRYRAMFDNFNRFLRTFYPHLQKISHFTPKVFEDFKSFRKSENANNSTINNELALYRQMFKQAVQWGYSKENPTDGVSRLKTIRKNAPEFLDKEQCKILLEACDDFMRPIVYTFLNTGMRKGELENLEWTDIDFKRRKLRIVLKDDWTPKSNEREIPINDGLMDLLNKKKAMRDSTTLVFSDKKGNKIEPNYLRKRFIRITEECGMPDVTRIHTLRHSFASHLVMNGVDLPTVKKLMGHSDIQTTMIYSHLTEKHVDDAVTTLDF